MKASKLRKVTRKEARKNRRKSILSDYKSLKHQIKKRTKRGLFFLDKSGGFRTAGEAARFLYLKSEGIRVVIKMTETYHGEWFCERIYISWGEKVKPECVINYNRRNDDDDEENY